MEISCQKRGRTLTVMLTGELDHHSAAQARSAIDALLVDGSVKELEFDMRQISFMDSSGLGVILGRYRTMTERGGSISITGASRYAQRILKMAGIYSLISSTNI